MDDDLVDRPLEKLRGALGREFNLTAEQARRAFTEKDFRQIYNQWARVSYDRGNAMASTCLAGLSGLGMVLARLDSATAPAIACGALGLVFAAAAAGYRVKAALSKRPLAARISKAPEAGLKPPL